MFFFVNQYLLSNNSSIEHAEIKRLKLFEQHNVPAKLVTCDFSPILHGNGTLKRFGLTDDEIINMFDYFGGTLNYQGKAMHVEDLNLPYRYQVGTGNNSREVKEGQQLVATIFFIGGTIGQIDHIDYYDLAGNITLRQKYDIRGFKAVDVFIGNDGQTDYEQYYRPDGSCYLERYYVRSTRNTAFNSRNILKNYQGKDRYFNNVQDLFTFFLNELNTNNKEENSFIADRPAISIEPIINIHGSAKKYLWLSFNHVDDGNNLITGPLNSFVQEALSHQNAWDGVIVMTQQQAQILRDRLTVKIPVYAINGVPVKKMNDKIQINQCVKGQVIAVGRLGKDKQTDRLIEMFAQIHRQVKEARLTFYGYGSPNEMKEFKNLVKQRDLEKVVQFTGYQVKLDQVYDQAQLFVDASRLDGQPLAMGEALSHGLPVVSYDYLYGPNELIQSGKNGELIPLNDESKFVNTVVTLLNNPEKLQELSDGAYSNLNSINEENTWKEWQKLGIGK